MYFANISKFVVFIVWIKKLLLSVLFCKTILYSLSTFNWNRNLFNNIVHVDIRNKGSQFKCGTPGPSELEAALQRLTPGAVAARRAALNTEYGDTDCRTPDSIMSTGSSGAYSGGMPWKLPDKLQVWFLVLITKYYCVWYETNRNSFLHFLEINVTTYDYERRG